jgi:hypothetical protein
MSARGSEPVEKAKDPANKGLLGPLWLIGLLVSLGIFLVLNFVLYRSSTMGGIGLRYLILPVIVSVLLFLAGGNFVKYLYRLESLQEGFSYLMSAAFGIGYARLGVSEGKPHIDRPGKINPITRIGGPGYLMVQPGNVVLLEDYAGSIRILGAGQHLISRTETVKEMLTLEEQKAQVEKMGATTRDGIEVVARDVQYRYRLDRGLAPKSSAGYIAENPFPYSEDAVIQMVYNRTLTANGISGWHFGVNQVVDTIITDYIRQHLFDHLTAPGAQGGDPRGEIYKQFYSEGGIKRFKEKGAELLWIDIGHFDIPEKQVAEQRLSTWQARWAGNANVVRAYGESHRLAFQEMGRAEAQAEMLMSIVHGLEDVGAQNDSRQNTRAIYLARIAQLLDAMGRQALPSGEAPARE